MKFKIKSSHKKILQLLLIGVILFIALKEFYSILVHADRRLFHMYADKLTFEKLLIVGALGIFSYLPLSFYDLLLRKRVHINLKIKELYKYSWIASSISNVVGFGGSSAILLKNHFYAKHTDNPKLLTKLLSKVVLFNLCGFAVVCFVFSIFNIKNHNFSGLNIIAAIVISMYIPLVLGFLFYKYLKTKDSKEFFFSLKICLISISEWITTLILIYGLMIILDMRINVWDFLSAYVSAIIVAMISMTPSGVGTFDLTLLVCLGKYGIPSEQVLLLILLYRISYYLVPMIIGILLYIFDVYKKADDEIKDLFKNIFSTISHFALCSVIFILALSILIIYISPSLIPDNIEQLSAKFRLGNTIAPVISMTLSFVMIISARVLYYKSINAYWVNLLLLLIITPFLLPFFGTGELIILAMIFILLICSKRKFHRKGFIMTIPMAIENILIFISILVCNLFLLKHNKLNFRRLPKFAIEAVQRQKEDFITQMFFALGIALIILFLIIYNNRKNKFPKKPLDKDKLNHIINTYGGSRLIHYAFLNDKYIYINNDDTVAIQYQISSNKIVILGNPVGKSDDFIPCLEEFYDLADTYGYTLVFTAIDEALIPALHDMGFEFMKIGEDAFVDLNDFSLVGNKNKSKRQAVSRIEKYGYQFSVISPPFTNEFMDKLKSISDEWLNGQKEKGFSIGFFNEEYLSLSDIAIVTNEDGEIKAFASLMPMYDNNETLSVDLTRFKEIDVNGIMDFLLIKIFDYGKSHGYTKFNMGLAPLSNVGLSRFAFLREKIAYQSFQHGNMFYSFAGLKSFKNKYASIWENRYIAYRKNYSLFICMLDLLQVVTRPSKKID